MSFLQSKKPCMSFCWNTFSESSYLGLLTPHLRAKNLLLKWAPDHYKISIYFNIFTKRGVIRINLQSIITKILKIHLPSRMHFWAFPEAAKCPVTLVWWVSSNFCVLCVWKLLEKWTTYTFTTHTTLLPSHQNEQSLQTRLTLITWHSFHRWSISCGWGHLVI